MKVDIEGGEYRVLLPAVDLLFKPRLLEWAYIEVWGASSGDASVAEWLALWQRIEDAGYDISLLQSQHRRLSHAERSNMFTASQSARIKDIDWIIRRRTQK
jgi:hypothetical protein